MIQHVKAAGFTLVELIVSIAIFMVLTAVVIFNYADFNSNTILTNMAYELSLTVREAQVYGIAVRPVGISSDDNFDQAYGVYAIIPGGAGASQFILYGDQPGNPDIDRYDPGEEIETFSLTRDIYITDICATFAGTEECGKQSLDISFKRPNPDARMIVTTSGGTEEDDAEAVRIVIRSPRGQERYVVIRVTGQISVEYPDEM